MEPKQDETKQESKYDKFLSKPMIAGRPIEDQQITLNSIRARDIKQISAAQITEGDFLSRGDIILPSEDGAASGIQYIGPSSLKFATVTTADPDNPTNVWEMYGYFDADSKQVRLISPSGGIITPEFMVRADIVPEDLLGTYKLGNGDRRWGDGYFVDLHYSGTLSNSHQVEDPSKLPVKKYKKGTVLTYSKNGVESSTKDNDSKVIGVYESKSKAVATFGVYYARVLGRVSKGDNLVTTKNGRCRKAHFWEKNYFAIAMENGKDSLIKVFIKP